MVWQMACMEVKDQVMSVFDLVVDLEIYLFVEGIIEELPVPECVGLAKSFLYLYDFKVGYELGAQHYFGHFPSKGQFCLVHFNDENRCCLPP